MQPLEFDGSIGANRDKVLAVIRGMKDKSFDLTVNSLAAKILPPNTPEARRRITKTALARRQSVVLAMLHKMGSTKYTSSVPGAQSSCASGVC